MAKKVVIPAMISMRIVEPDAVMPKNLSSPAAFLVLVTNNSSLILIHVQNGSQGAAGAEKVMREGSVSDGNTPLRRKRWGKLPEHCITLSTKRPCIFRHIGGSSQKPSVSRGRNVNFSPFRQR